MARNGVDKFNKYDVHNNTYKKFSNDASRRLT